jgi:hypothetical protein
MRVCGLSVIFIAKKGVIKGGIPPFCVKYVLKLKASLAVLNLILIFAVSKGNKLLTIKTQSYEKIFCKRKRDKRTKSKRD